MSKKKVFGLIGGLVILLAINFVPTPAGLSVAAKNMMGVLLAALVMWTTEIVPLPVTALGLLVLLPMYGITDLITAFKEFASPVIFFVIATSGISCALLKTSLAARMAAWLLMKAGSGSTRVILAFTAGTALISTCVSNVPAAALFMGLAISLLDAMGAKPGESRLGRSLMIAIPFGAMVGGIATPAGSSINILALYLLEKYTQIRISFFDWMLFGIPIMVIMVPVITYVIVKLFKPEPVNINIADLLKEKDGATEGLAPVEKKVLIIIGLMMVFWIASTWVPALNITTVAVLGMIAFFAPGIEVFTWDEFNKEVGWDTIIMIGSVTSVGAAVVSTGLSSWFIEMVLGGLASFGVVTLTALVGLLINWLHLVLPLGPAIVAVSIQPLSELAGLAGINPAIFALTTSFLAGCVMLLPLDPVPLITYNKRFYTMLDMFKAGTITSTVWVILAAIWIPAVALLLGY